MLGMPVKAIGRRGAASTTLVGLNPLSRLVNLVGPDGRRLSLRPGVVLVSTLLRKKLGVTTGDRLLLRYAFQTKYRRGEILATVGPPLRLPVGQSLYMPIADVRRAFRDPLDLPPGAITTIVVRTSPQAHFLIHRWLQDVPFAVSVSSIRQTKKDIDEQMGLSRSCLPSAQSWPSALFTRRFP